MAEILDKPLQSNTDKITIGNGEDLSAYIQNKSNQSTDINKDVNNKPVESTNTEKVLTDPVIETLKKELGAEYDSWDKVKQRLGSKVEVDPELAKLLPDLQFAQKNPQAMQLAKLAAEGGDVSTYWKVTNTDVTNLKPIDALKLRYVFEHGMDEQTAEKGIKSVFKLFTPEELESMGASDYNEAEKAAASLTFAQETKAAKEWLKDFQEKAKIPPQEQQRLLVEEATKKEKQKVAESWNGEFDKLASSLSIGVKNDIDYRDMKVPLDFNYTFTPEQQQQFKEVLKNIVGDGNTQLNEKNIQWAKQLGEAIVFHSNLEGFTKAIQKNTLDAIDKVIGEKFYNIPAVKSTNQPDTDQRTNSYTVHESKSQNTQQKEGIGGLKKD